MNLQEAVATILILLGAIVMALSIARTRKIFHLLREGKYQRIWKILLVLMVFFLVGYLCTSYLVNTDVTSLLLILVGSVFFSGALFVFLVVQSGYTTMEFLDSKVLERTRELSERNRLLVRSQEDLAAARDRAMAASRAKSTFLANMSHELRTPLNAIIGYSELLEEEAHDRKIDWLGTDLVKIRSAGLHLLTLINEILDLSKIEAGKMELHLETFDVREAVREVVTTIEPLMSRNNTTLDVRVADDVGTMHADPTKVRQCLFNLLSNACKFNPDGRNILRVYRETRDGKEWMLFGVEDTGIGIGRDQLEKVFESFSQVCETPSRGQRGTGLGLSITKKFCEIMNGEITVESELGKGSTFTIRFPVRVEDRAPARPEASADPGAQAGVAAPSGTALVIDDDADAVQTLGRWLAKEGFRVISARDGRSGLDLARKERPDLITLDVLMPEVDGWAVLAEIKSDPALGRIPVIMVTIVDDSSMGYALGVSDFLTKPIDRQRLSAVLAKIRRDGPQRPVLVVEDDEEMRRILRRTLEKEGFEVVEAENGLAALERIERSAPGLILLDLVMPVMDGFELVEKLRGNEAWRSIPVVVVTVKDLTGEERARLDEGVQAILRKGAHSLDDLGRIVTDLVRRYVRRGEGARTPPRG